MSDNAPKSTRKRTNKLTKKNPSKNGAQAGPLANVLLLVVSGALVLITLALVGAVPTLFIPFNRLLGFWLTDNRKLYRCRDLFRINYWLLSDVARSRRNSHSKQRYTRTRRRDELYFKHSRFVWVFRAFIYVFIDSAFFYVTSMRGLDMVCIEFSVECFAF